MVETKQGTSRDHEQGDPKSQIRSEDSMRQYNPVREGLKKHPTAHAYYLTLKERARTGLTALEWDWYRARQKEFEPDAYAAEMKEGERRVAIDYARKLSVDDLKAVLAEHEALAVSNGERA
jgi:hypothetical protein